MRTCTSGRGYASAVVLHAAETARRAGTEFVFLVADATTGHSTGTGGSASSRWATT
jgi:predicted GNAT family acetyltransferase